MAILHRSSISQSSGGGGGGGGGSSGTIDLDVDADGNGSISSDDESLEDLAPSNAAIGPYLCVNNDDDNGDLIQDRFTDNIDNGNDVVNMQEITMSISFSNTTISNVEVRLKGLLGTDKIRLFDFRLGVGNETVINLEGNGTTYPAVSFPSIMRLEGILPSASKRDIRIEAAILIRTRPNIDN